MFLFDLFAHPGRGFLSTQKTDMSVLPHQALGQAKLQVAYNTARESLLVKEAPPLIIDNHFETDVGMHYESGAWRLSCDERLVFEAGTLNQVGAVIAYAGLSFSYEADTQDYVAFSESGKQTLTYTAGSGFDLQIAGGAFVRHFDVEGGIEKDVRPSGVARRYLRDAARRLSEIALHSGAKILFDYSVQQTVTVQYQSQDGSLTPLASHRFSDLGCTALIRTVYLNASGYQIDYQYTDDGTRLSEITQSDKSALYFEYDAQIPSRLCRIRQGAEELAQLRYSANTCKLEAVGACFEVSHDDAQYLAKITRTQAGGKPVTQDCFRDDKKRLTEHRQGAVYARFRYNQAGLIEYTEKGLRDSQGEQVLSKTGFTYTVFGDLASKQTGGLAPTRHYYDDSRRRVFSVSPSGVVRAFCYAAPERLTEIRRYRRRYRQAEFTTAALQAWALGGENAFDVMAQFDAYDALGQVRKRSVANTLWSPDKTQVETDVTETVFDFNGRLLSETRTCSGVEQGTQTHRYDGLSRLQSRTDCLGATTQYSYAGAISTTMCPNMRVETVETDGALRVRSTSAAVDAVVRSEVHSPLGQGWWCIKQHDGQVRYRRLYPLQQTQCDIDAMGYVTYYEYDEVGNLSHTTHYAKALNLPADVGLLSGPVQALLERVSDASARTTSTLYIEGKLHFIISPSGAVTQKCYDLAGRVVQTKQYATLFTQARELVGGVLSGLVESTADRTVHAFYNDDSDLIAEQDAQGYLVRYQLDQRGQRLQARYYHQPLRCRWNAADSDLQNNPSHAHFWLRDTQGRVRYEINAVGEVRYVEYHGCGKVSLERQFATRLSAKVLQALLDKGDGVSESDLESALRSLSQDEALDRTTRYDYDKAGNRISEQHPNGLTIYRDYDPKTQILRLEQRIDTLAPADSDSAKEQHHLEYHNAWAEHTATLTPRLAKKAGISGRTRWENVSWDEQIVQKRCFFEAQTGLQTHSSDALGARTYYYYNAKRALVYRIDPKGAVTAFSYNGLDSEPVSTTIYGRYLEKAYLATLSGGFIDARMRARLDACGDASSDVVKQQQFAKNGKVERQIDAAGFETVRMYNAFDECESLSEDTGSVPGELQLTTEQIFGDKRGFATQTTLSTSDNQGKRLRKTLQATYDVHGRVKTSQDAKGRKTVFECDDVGREIAREKNGRRQTQSYNAFSECISKSVPFTGERALGYHTYRIEQGGRSVTACSPMGSQTVQHQDAFGNILKTVHADESTTQRCYAPDNQCVRQKNALGGRQEKSYDDRGYCKMTVDPLLHKTTQSVDLGGCIESLSMGEGAGAVRRGFSYHPAGFVVSEQDGEGTITTFKRSGRGELLESALPLGESESRHKTWVRDGGGRVRRLLEVQRDTKGVTDKDKALVECYYDGFGRLCLRVQDPDVLKLSECFEYDDKDNLLATKGPDHSDLVPDVSYALYDCHDDVCYQIDNLGYVTSYVYNAQHQPIQTLRYANPLDIRTCYAQYRDRGDQGLKAFIASEIEAKRLDPQAPDAGLSNSYYDLDGKKTHELIAIDEKAFALIAYTFDARGRMQGKIRYSLPVSIDGYEAGQSLSALTEANPIDQVIATYRDAAGHPRFVIDGEGFVTQMRYDLKSQLYATIHYETPFAPWGRSVLPTMAALSAFFKTHTTDNDRVTRFVRDARGNVRFEIDPAGFVIEKRHNKRGHVTQKTCYVQAVTLEEVQPTIEAVEAVLKPCGADETAQFEPDTQGRVCGYLDAQGGRHETCFNVFDKPVRQTDPAKQYWQFEYDGVGRQTGLVNPKTLNYSSELKGREIALSEQESEIRETTQWSNSGRVKQKTHGISSEAGRTLDIDFDRVTRKRRRCVVAAVDKAQAVSLENFHLHPSQLETVTQTEVLNGAEKPLVTIDEQGRMRFTVYDRRGLACYVVDNQGQVSELVRDVRGNVSAKIAYANALSLKLSDYQDRGLSLRVVKGALKTSPLDRRTEYHYDKRDNVIETRAAVVTTVSPTGDGRGLEIKTEQGLRTARFNAFGEKDYECTHQQGNQCKERRVFHNQQGKEGLIVACGAITEHHYNHHGLLTRAHRFAGRWAGGVGLAQAKRSEIALVGSKDDRIGLKKYDKNQSLVFEGLDELAHQALSGEEHTSVLEVAPHEVGTCYELDSRGLPVKITLPNGAVQHQFFDAKGELIALLLPEREIELPTGERVRARPFKRLHYNLHRNLVCESHFAQSHWSGDLGVLPEGVGEPRRHLTVVDVRGLVAYVQDPTGALQLKTYYRDGKLAREARLLDSSLYGEKVLERRRDYHDNGQLSHLTETLKAEQQHTRTRCNVFGETTGEAYDSSGDDYPAYEKRDKRGRVWHTNKPGGVDTVYFYNNADEVSAVMQSAGSVLLSPKGVPTIEAAIALLKEGDPKKVRIWIKARDASGNVVANHLPVRCVRDRSQPRAFETSVTLSTQYLPDGALTLSWLDLGEPELKARLTLYPVGKPGAATHFSERAPDAMLTALAGRLIARVEALASDQYQFEIAYFDAQDERFEHPRRKATGQATIETAHHQESTHPVGIVSEDSQQFRVSGHTAEIDGIQIVDADNALVAMCPLMQAGTQKVADISAIPPGVYRFSYVKNVLTVGQTIDGAQVQEMLPRIERRALSDQSRTCFTWSTVGADVSRIRITRTKARFETLGSNSYEDHIKVLSGAPEEVVKEIDIRRDDPGHLECESREADTFKVYGVTEGGAAVLLACFEGETVHHHADEKVLCFEVAEVAPGASLKVDFSDGSTGIYPIACVGKQCTVRLPRDKSAHALSLVKRSYTPCAYAAFEQVINRCEVPKTFHAQLISIEGLCVYTEEPVTEAKRAGSFRDGERGLSKVQWEALSPGQLVDEAGLSLALALHHDGSEVTLPCLSPSERPVPDHGTPWPWSAQAIREVMGWPENYDMAKAVIETDFFGNADDIDGRQKSEYDAWLSRPIRALVPIAGGDSITLLVRPSQAQTSGAIDMQTEAQGAIGQAYRARSVLALSDLDADAFARLKRVIKAPLPAALVAKINGIGFKAQAQTVFSSEEAQALKTFLDTNHQTDLSQLVRVTPPNYRLSLSRKRYGDGQRLYLAPFKAVDPDVGVLHQFVFEYFSQETQAWERLGQDRFAQTRCGVSVDLEHLAAGTYRYRYKAVDTQNQPSFVYPESIRQTLTAETDYYHYGEITLGLGGRHFPATNLDLHAQLEVGPIEEQSFNVFNELESQTDALRQRKTFEYNQLGGVRKQTAEDGSVTQIASDCTGQVIASTDAANNTHFSPRSETGRVERYLSAEGTEVKLHHDSFDQVVSVDDPQGHNTKLKRNDNHYVTEITHPTGKAERLTPDRRGREIKGRNGAGEETLTEQGLGGPIETRSPAQRIVKRAYHHSGIVTKVETHSASGVHTSVQEVDDFGRILAEVDETGARFEHAWNKAGERSETREIAGTGKTERLAHLDSDEKRSVLPLKHILYIRDEAGQITTTQDFGTGVVQTQEYNLKGEALSLQVKDSRGRLICDVAITLSARGQIERYRDLNLIAHFTYNLLQQRIKEVIQIQSIEYSSPTVIRAHGVDKDGRYTLINGTLNAAGQAEAGPNSTARAFVGNWLITQRTRDEDNRPSVTNFEYNEDGELVKTRAQAEDTVRELDAANRTTRYQVFDSGHGDDFIRARLHYAGHEAATLKRAQDALKAHLADILPKKGARKGSFDEMLAKLVPGLASYTKGRTVENAQALERVLKGLKERLRASLRSLGLNENLPLIASLSAHWLAQFSPILLSLAPAAENITQFWQACTRHLFAGLLYGEQFVHKPGFFARLLGKKPDRDAPKRTNPLDISHITLPASAAITLLSGLKTTCEDLIHGTPLLDVETGDMYVHENALKFAKHAVGYQIRPGALPLEDLRDYHRIVKTENGTEVQRYQKKKGEDVFSWQAITDKAKIVLASALKRLVHIAVTDGLGLLWEIVEDITKSFHLSFFNDKLLLIIKQKIMHLGQAAEDWIDRHIDQFTPHEAAGPAPKTSEQDKAIRDKILQEHRKTLARLLPKRLQPQTKHAKMPLRAVNPNDVGAKPDINRLDAKPFEPVRSHNPQALREVESTFSQGQLTGEKTYERGELVSTTTHDHVDNTQALHSHTSFVSGQGTLESDTQVRVVYAGGEQVTQIATTVTNNIPGTHTVDGPADSQTSVYFDSNRHVDSVIELGRTGQSEALGESSRRALTRTVDGSLLVKRAYHPAQESSVALRETHFLRDPRDLSLIGMREESFGSEMDPKNTRTVNFNLDASLQPGRTTIRVNAGESVLAAIVRQCSPITAGEAALLAHLSGHHPEEVARIPLLLNIPMHYVGSGSGHVEVGIGRLYPSLLIPTIVANKLKAPHHAWVLEFVEIAVAVALAVLVPVMAGFVANAAFGVATLAAASPGVTFASFAIAGAAASVATDITTSLIAHRSIHWEEVLKEAAVAALASGTGGNFSGARLSASEAALRAAEVSFVNQVSSIAVGLSRKINWESVLISAASAGSSNKVSVGEKAGYIESLVQSATGSAVSTELNAMLIEHSHARWDEAMRSFAASTFGSYAGRQISGPLEERLQAHLEWEAAEQSPGRTRRTVSNPVTLYARGQNRRNEQARDMEEALSEQSTMAEEAFESSLEALGDTWAARAGSLAITNPFKPDAFSSKHWYSGMVNDVGAVGEGLWDTARDFAGMLRHPLTQVGIPLAQFAGDVGTLSAYYLETQALHEVPSATDVAAARFAFDKMAHRAEALVNLAGDFNEALTHGDMPTKLYTASRAVGTLFGPGAALKAAKRLEIIESATAVANRAVSLTGKGANGLRQLGLFGGRGVGVEELFLLKTGSLSAEEANLPFIETGKRPPYTARSRARIIQLKNRKSGFVRVHGDNNQIRGWLMRAKEIEGLTAQEIKNKFALPNLPKYISEVHLPDNFYLQLGRTASQEGWGAGGGIQYEALERLDESCFSEPQLIEAYNAGSRFNLAGVR